MVVTEDQDMQFLIALIEKREALRDRPAASILDVVRLEHGMTEQAAAVLGRGRLAAVRAIRVLAKTPLELKEMAG